MIRTTIHRAVAAALLGSALVATALPTLAQPFGEPGRGAGPRSTQMSDADRAQMRERMQTRINQRLDRLAARLEIKASQQQAWEAYRKVRTSMFEAMPQRPARDADAATRARLRAEMAQRRAQHLVAMADATEQLQAALEPDQRKVLDEISRHSGQRGQHGGQRGGHHRGHGGSARS